MAEITSIQDLTTYAKGQIVELPPFAEGQPFVARLRRPSMLALAKTGKIPNTLLITANNLFSGKGVKNEEEDAMKEVFGVIDIMAEACLLDPTYQQLKEIGLELTDEQMMFIFSYSQQGVKALEPFRGESANRVNHRASAKVQKNTD